MDWQTVIFVGLKILAVIFLVMMNGFFVATEFALVKVRQTQLDPLIAKGHRRASMVRHLIQHIDAYLSAAQLGITLASLALGWIGEPIFAELLKPVFKALNLSGAEHETLRHTIAVVVGFSGITFLHIVAGEQAPKSFGIRQSLKTALLVAYPVRWFYMVAYPFIWVLNESSLWLLRVIGIEPVHETEGAASEDELRLLVASSQKHFGASRFSRDLVQNSLALRHRIVREVMRPRRDITLLDTKASLAECLAVAEQSRYSRFPLCEEGDLDRTLGVVHIKDLYALRQKVSNGAQLVPVAHRLVYVPETARLEKVFELFLARKLHLGIVVDEYGATVGMVTLENILEEIVGQIQDEFDAEKPQLIQVSDNEWELSGTVSLHQIEPLVDVSLAEGGISTVSGLVTSRLGGFPKVGDRVSIGPGELLVEEMDGLLVSRVRLKRESREPASED